MAIVVTITAETPAQLAPMWAGLGGHVATVNLDADHMWIDVDMRQPVEDGAEPFEDPAEPAQDPVDELVPINSDPQPEDQVDDIAEPAVDADVVAIDRKARDKHPAGKAADSPTCADAVLEVLASDAGHNWPVPDIVNAVRGYKESTVKFTIAQLVRDGQIARAGRGLYRAVG